MTDLWNKMLAYARKSPVQFVALGSFSVLGAIPVLAFVAYSVATLVATIVGALVIELFLLAAGITGLAFVLFFVTCTSVCVTSVFGALFFGYQAASTTLSKTKGMGFRLSRGSVWPYTSSNTTTITTTSETAELQEHREGSGDTDKTK